MTGSPLPRSSKPPVGPFDPDELVRWAETYGHPEEWAKHAQNATARAERLAAEVDRLHEQNDSLHTAAELLGAGQDRLRRALEQLDGHVGHREQAIISQTLRPPAPADQQGAA